MKNIAQFFVDRPIMAAVLSLLFLIAGGIAVFQLPISEYPQVVPPTVVVRAQYPGANPEVIAQTVATPLEQSINGAQGMLYSSSQATSDGTMTLTSPSHWGPISTKRRSKCRTAWRRRCRACQKRSSGSA